MPLIWFKDGPPLATERLYRESINIGVLMKFYKFMPILLSLFSSIAFAEHASTIDKNTIKRYLQDNKAEIEKCEVNIQSNGKKLEPFPKHAKNSEFYINGDGKFFVDERECTVEDQTNGVRLNCGYYGARSQNIRMSSAILLIYFDDNGNFKRLTKSYMIGGFLIAAAPKPVQINCASDQETESPSVEIHDSYRSQMDVDADE